MYWGYRLEKLNETESTFQVQYNVLLSGVLDLLKPLKHLRNQWKTLWICILELRHPECTDGMMVCQWLKWTEESAHCSRLCTCQKMAHKSYADPFFFSKKCVCHAKLSLYLNQIFAKDSFFYFLFEEVLLLLWLLFSFYYWKHISKTQPLLMRCKIYDSVCRWCQRLPSVLYKERILHLFKVIIQRRLENDWSINIISPPLSWELPLWQMESGNNHLSVCLLSRQPEVFIYSIANLLGISSG